MVGGAHAQTVVWSENFDDGNGNSRWYADAGVWQMGSPTIGPATNSAGYRTHSGSNCATTGLTANYPAGANSRLIRIQTFTVPDASLFPRLRFWQWYQFAYNDYGVVEIKVGTNAWQAISPRYGGYSGDWSYASVDMSSYAGQTVQLAFHLIYQSGYSGTGVGWDVDDIAFETGTPIFNNPEGWEGGIGDWYAESGTWQVGIPTSGPGAAHTGTNCAATILNGNYPSGANSRLISPSILVPAASQFPRLRFWHWYQFAYNDIGVVEIKVGTNAWQAISPQYGGYSGDWTYASVDLSSYAGKTVQLAFHLIYQSGYSGTSAGWYLDDIALLTGAPVFNNPEGWEGGIGSWYAESGTWQVGKPTSGPGAAHTGTNCAATILNGNYPSGVNSRLISPAFILPPASTSPFLRFWHWFQFAYDDYGVVEIRIGTNAWQTLAACDGSYPTYGGSSGAWTEPCYDLSSYGGQTVQLAFHMIYQSGYSGTSSGWYMDDLQIFPYVIPITNPPPTIFIPNTNINELAQWQYTPTVTGSGYTYGLSNAPAGMTVNASSGTISWTPVQTNATHTYSTITYAVYQSSSVVAWTNFNVTVNDLNMLPGFILTPGAQTVYATTLLSVTDAATNGDIWATGIAYALVSPPTGATNNPTTGVITWTPSISQTGTYTLTVTATDNDPYAVNSQQLSASNSFTVVVKGLTPPSFTLSPTNLVVGAGRGFTFTALATGYPAPTYQWQFSSNGVTYANLPAGTGNSFGFASSGLTNIGYYRVVAANAQGSVTNTVRLTFLNLNLYAGLNILGPINAIYTIKSSPTAYGTNWNTLTNVALPSQPYIYIDYNSPTNSHQFYQALPQ